MREHDPENPGTRIACRDLVELLTDYLDGALTTPTDAEVEAHLAICPPCRAYLGQVERTVAELGLIAATEQLCEETRDDVLNAFRTLVRPEARGPAPGGPTAD